MVRLRTFLERPSCTVRSMNNAMRRPTVLTTIRASIAGLLVAALAGAACSSDDAALATTPALATPTVEETTDLAPTPSPVLSATTVATSAPPATATRLLRIAHIDGSDNLDPATTWFVDALARRSGGALTAEVSFTCCGRGADVEQALLDQVRSGGVELGWVGVRAFAQAGTTAFEPLLTPLLIRSYAAEQAVVGSDVAGGLLAQLEPLGLVGLGLLPGSLRYPMSTGAPLTMPADWEGQPAYVFESQIVSDAIVALGATPVTVSLDERDERLSAGSIVALDNTVRFHAARVDLFTNLVADVPLWSRVSALVAGPTTEFTAEEQRWIAEAVADVSARTTELGEIDRVEAGLACALSDPGYVLAGPEGIAAYETTLEPVEAELAADPRNAAILEALHELVAGIPAESPVTCERVGDVPDTSGITLRTLIAAPVEHPSLSGANDGGARAIPVIYDSGGLTISARLSLPAGSGPFPAVVLVQPFGGLEREAERLVDAGYVVLETDLRGHGNSDPDPSQSTDLEMGSTLDVVNAARALAVEPRVDASRIALVGAGLGGLIVINAEVVAPEVAAAVIAKNPSSIDVWQNIEYYFEPDDEARALIVDSRGTPDDNPTLWADLSPVTFADRIDSPLLILQGTGDTGNDPSWSDATVHTFTDAGKAAEVITFEGADFVLDPSWEDAIATIEEFLADDL
jgi:TRAP-type C4-dicarboxylate transport system substrate-binding protein/dienelactone hydrolase